jgi:uncharacterized membrane protein YfcA
MLDLAHTAAGLRGLLLFTAGAVASGLNAVGGGGSLLTFPTLVALGIPALSPTATNSAALWPGSLGSALGLWEPLRESRAALPTLLIPTVLGAMHRCLAAARGRRTVFRWAVPPLILLATALLAFQPQLRKLGHTGRHIPGWLGMLLQLGSRSTVATLAPAWAS